MATPTYTPIESYTLGSPATSVTFGSGNTLPQTYTDLVIVIQGAQDSSYSARNMAIRFNGDTGSNYSSVQILNSSSGADANLGSAYGPLINSSTNTTSGALSNAIINIQNYASNNMYKSILCKGGSAAAFTSGGSNVGTYVGINTAIWRNTAPVTQVTVYASNTSGSGSGANWIAGSTFTLYGIANTAIGAPKATGGIITYDNTYYYHTFGASGTFTPQQSLTADILVVAGGGGGTSAFGGGGGAGGLLGFASQSLTATGYTVTVGAGGAGGANNANTVAGSTGVDSQFGALTLVKGGGGAQAYESDTAGSAANGGSGAGGTYRESSKSNRNPFGTATSGQGNNGGSNNFASYTYASGGGGGAGAVGGAGFGNERAGNGGAGSTAYSSWGLVTGTGQNVSGTVYYAGGGAGGQGSIANPLAVGGAGGGGNSVAGSSSSTLAQAGMANTGGGGGGGSYSGGSGAGGGNGGSGVVIIRYLKA